MKSPFILGADTKPPSDLGRKAITLHQLLSAGLPVPPAIVLPHAIATDLTALRYAAGHLGYPLAVRSSANVEDLADSAAPGLFESVLNVTSEEELIQAAAQASAETPLVSAYLKARGIETQAKVAIIVQEQVVATVALGVLYTRPPGRPKAPQAILEVPGQRPIWLDRKSDGAELCRNFPLSLEQVNELWGLAQEVEKVLGSERGLDVEWVWGSGGPQLLQARPIVHREDLVTANISEIGDLLAFSKGDRERLWRLDATHNPLPLSPAQAGLVEEVAPLAPYEMRVVGGYLYTSKRTRKLVPNELASVFNAPCFAERGCFAPSALRSGVLHQTPSTVPATLLSQEQVHKLFEEQLVPKMEMALAAVERAEPPSLGDALSAYKEVFSCLTSELAPALMASEELEGGNPLSVWLARAVAGQITKEELMRRVAPIAPAWDVSVPTYGETPERVENALRIHLGTARANAEMVVSLRERDDLFFFRAQYVMRRALCSLASRWNVGDLIFFMPLRSVLACQKQATVSADRIEQAKAAQALVAMQQAVEMPLAFAGGEALPTRFPPNAELWQGIGTGGHVSGRVVRVASLTDFPILSQDEQVVLVLPTVTPAHALAARGAVAVVCEYGEHLGHGAAMARELGIPCIVGCKRAWRELMTGDRVAVHGDAGLVVRLY